LTEYEQEVLLNCGLVLESKFAKFNRRNGNVCAKTLGGANKSKTDEEGTAAPKESRRNLELLLVSRVDRGIFAL
jgi:hypothetical protein